jgi:cytochrome b561
MSSFVSRKKSASDKSHGMIAVHWVSALLVFLTFSLAWGKEFFDEETNIWKQFMGLHKQIGIVILILLVARLVIRFKKQSNLNQNSMPSLLLWAGRCGHFLLYVSLLTMPLLGWAMSNARGRAVTLFGVLPLPSLATINLEKADFFQDWHTRISWMLCALIVVHILAALWHHFIRKDDVLISVLPWLRKL